MEIRRIDVEDISIYKEEITEFVYESVKMSNYEESYTYGQAINKIQELYSYIESDQAIVLGAFDEKKIVGFLWSYTYPFREDINRLYISILHVKVEYRGQAIGTRLVQYIERLAKDSGYGGIYLHTEALNVGACKFYKKMKYVEERIQYVKKIGNDAQNIVKQCYETSGGVILGTFEDVDRYRKQFVNLYYQNVKAHIYVDEFNKNEAEKKIENLCDYLRKGKAYLFYKLSNDDVMCFIWAHPICYKNAERIYIHACGVNNCHKGKGYASDLYSFILKYPFGRKDIYTHVDAKNIISCNLHQKFGFVIERYQYCKRCI